MTVPWDDDLDAIFGGDLTAALGYRTPAAGVVVQAVAPIGLRDRDRGTLGFTTSLGFSKKLDRIAADPRVAMAFHAREHGSATGTAYVLAQGTARVIESPTEEQRSQVRAHATAHLGPPAEGVFWDRWLREYYVTRVPVEVTVTRILTWPTLDAAGAPDVAAGEALSAQPAEPQRPPKNGTGPRIDVARACTRLRSAAHSVLGYAGADGAPVVVPVELGAEDESGIAVTCAAPLPPGASRRSARAHLQAATDRARDAPAHRLARGQRGRRRPLRAPHAGPLPGPRQQDTAPVTQWRARQEGRPTGGQDRQDVEGMTVAADDRLLPATRWAALVIFIVLVPAVVVLWGTPGETADRWAWTIKPDLTPIFLGSGDGAGAYFFWRTFRATRWHPSSAGVLGASLFAALMLIATIIHWDRFSHGDAPFLAAVAFWGWTVIYIISPAVVFALWWRNRATDPGEPAPGEPLLSAGALLAARAFAGVALVAAAVCFLSPTTAIDIWPWTLTPLTARVLASFTAQVGVGALVLSLDRRWSSWRLIVETFFVATAFLLVGAVRACDDFDEGNVMTYLYLGGLVAADVALLTLLIRTEASASADERHPTAPAS